MIFKATIYSVIAHFVFSTIMVFFPALSSGAFGVTVGLLLAPFIGGYLVYTIDNYEFSKSERWSFASMFSLVLTALAGAFIWYHMGTPEGAAILAEHNVQSGPGFYFATVFAFVFVFLVYLFANRIGVGFGIKIAKATGEATANAAVKPRF